MYVNINGIQTFTQKNLYTEGPLNGFFFNHRETLHGETFTHSRVYTEKLLHKEIFTQMIFTHKRVCTEKLFHTETVAHRSFYRDIFLHKKMHRETFTQRNLYTETFLHTEGFTKRTFYTKISLRSLYTEYILWCCKIIVLPQFLPFDLPFVQNLSICAI